MLSGKIQTIYPMRVIAGLAVLSSLLCGCLGGGDPVDAAEDRVTLAVAAAIVNTTFSDATGRIQIRVKTCDPTATAFTNCAYCSVDEGWARIGGGAQIIGEASGGAMLQASFPSPNSFGVTNAYGCTGAANPVQNDFLGTWVTRASGANHQLQAYVIGMRIKGNDGLWYEPKTTEGRDLVTGSVNPPGIFSVEVPESWAPVGYYLIGGGGTAFTTNPANSITAPTNAYLVGSRPVDGSSGRVWRASARSQSNPAPDEALKSYGIFIEACPAQMSPKCLTYPTIRSVTSSSNSGYGTATLTIPEFQVSGTIGGYSPSSSGGARYLADLIPFNGSSQGFTVRSKAYGTGTGQTTGYALTFGLPFDIYTIVYNHSNKCMGILDARTDATAPVAQQTCTFGNQPSNLRFAMVPQTGGYVGLRFEHSGMCVDISGASLNNSAAAIQYPCSFADNQLVQLVNNANGSKSYKFKHSGKCLDVTGASTADGARFIQYTCNGGTNQSFYFDD